MPRPEKRGTHSPADATAAPAVRRRRIRERFDESVDRERHRYSGSAWRVLVRDLRVRFLAHHLPAGKGWVLELGPGPGRFTPSILTTGARVVAVDLSLPMLHALGRHAAVRARTRQLRRVRGAGERLPFGDGSFRAVVAYGNLLGFAARDGERLLAELARVVRPGGHLILDVASPVGAATEFLTQGAERRLLLRILRDPDFYFLSQVLGARGRGHQPYAPERWAPWEFDFYTPAAAEALLADAGFRVVDRMAVGAIGAYRDRLATIARRDRRTWATLLSIEEDVGRRAGVLETGHGFVVAAVRRRDASPLRSRD